MGFWSGLDLAPGVLPRRLELLDIGARGGAQWPWVSLPHDCLDVTLVEADPDEAERLRADSARRGRGTVLPVALWSEETTLTLHLNRSPGTSSVFKPNLALLNQFPNPERFETMSTVSMATRTIDGLAATGELGGIDVAKIDVQGAELAILRGGSRHLSQNLVALELEVSFCELYTGQPLFADVDAAVRGLGLELWDLRKTYWKYQRGYQVPGPQKGRLVFGDALYFRSPAGLESWLATKPVADAQSKVAMLLVAALAYGYVDYAAAVMDEPSIAPFVEPGARTGLTAAIRSVGSGVRLPLHGNRYLYWIGHLLAAASRTSHGGWATTGSGLGSRRRGPFWS